MFLVNTIIEVFVLLIKAIWGIFLGINYIFGLLLRGLMLPFVDLDDMLEEEKKQSSKSTKEEVSKPVTQSSAEVYRTEEADLIQMIAAQRVKDREVYYETDMTAVPDDLRLEYRQYLKGLTWKNLRNLAIKRDNHRCTECGYIGFLEVHHTSYKGIYEMDFELSQLVTLCDLCHADEHKRLKALKEN